MHTIDVKFKNRSEVVKFLLEAQEAGIDYKVDIKLVEELENKFKALEDAGIDITPKVQPKIIEPVKKRGRGRPKKKSI